MRYKHDMNGVLWDGDKAILKLYPAQHYSIDKAKEVLTKLNAEPIAPPAPSPAGRLTAFDRIQLRDWFAGMGMTVPQNPYVAESVRAKHAFALADAMLEARAPKASGSAPLAPLSPVESLAISLCTRMKNIDPSKGGDDDNPPTGETYNLLWDAICDEILAVLPEFPLTKYLEGVKGL